MVVREAKIKIAKLRHIPAHRKASARHCDV